MVVALGRVFNVGSSWRRQLTICRAGLSSTSESRSQQDMMWRNQVPILELALRVEGVEDIVEDSGFEWMLRERFRWVCILSEDVEID